MASTKTLTQCYQLQDQLFNLATATDCPKEKSMLTNAWNTIVGRQRELRGVPPLKPVEARKKVHYSQKQNALQLPQEITDVIASPVVPVDPATPQDQTSGDSEGNKL